MFELLFAIPKSRRWTVPPEQTKGGLIILGILFLLWFLWQLLKMWFAEIKWRETHRESMRKVLPPEKWNDPEAYGVYSWDRGVRKRQRQKWKEEEEERKRKNRSK